MLHTDVDQRCFIHAWLQLPLVWRQWMNIAALLLVFPSFLLFLLSVPNKFDNEILSLSRLWQTYNGQVKAVHMNLTLMRYLESLDLVLDMIHCVIHSFCFTPTNTLSSFMISTADPLNNATRMRGIYSSYISFGHGQITSPFWFHPGPYSSLLAPIPFPFPFAAWYTMAILGRDSQRRRVPPPSWTSQLRVDDVTDAEYDRAFEKCVWNVQWPNA
jgi:hypothetical protein